MGQLMYSADDTLVTAQQLAAVPTPRPMGRFHQPMPFGTFLGLIKHRLELAGIDVAHEEYVVSKDHQTFFGSMAIRVDGFERDDMELTLGLRGSHNQKVPRGICLGNRVIVCSNLMFNGDLANMSTKQTLNIGSRLPVMIDQAVEQIPHLAQREDRRVGVFKQFDMRPRHGDAALVELHRRDALSGAQLTRAVREWDEPSYEEHAEDGHTAWRLLNAVTEAQKPTGETCNMDTVRRRTSIASRWLDEVVGL